VFLGWQLLRRSVSADVVRYVVQTRWRDLDAVRAFAGDDLEVAVVPRAAQALLTRYDQHVEHYEVALRV
jgi:heme-degrading monooxygenase HmoA